MPTRQMKACSSLKPALRPGVRYRRELEGAIIFDPAIMGIFATNPTGLLILKKINGRTSCAQIVQRLQRRFVSTSKRTLHRDLHRFLQDLASIGLIEFES